MLSDIEAACRDKGFTPLVCNTNNEVDQKLHHLDLLRSYQIEGIVVNAVGMRVEGLHRLLQSALPMVQIGRKIPDFDCDMVGLDNTQATSSCSVLTSWNGPSWLEWVHHWLFWNSTMASAIETFGLLACYSAPEPLFLANGNLNPPTSRAT